MEVQRDSAEALRDVLAIIIKHKAIFFITVVFTMLTVFVGLQFYTPRYKASVTLLIEGETASSAEYYQDFRTRATKTIYEGEIVRSRAVIERVVSALQLYRRPLDYEKTYTSKLKAYFIEKKAKKFKKDLDKITEEERMRFLFNRQISQLKGSISFEQVRDTKMFKISYVDFSPSMAVIIANSISRSYLMFDLERQFVEISLKYGDEYSQTRQVKDYIRKVGETLHGMPIPHIDAIGPASVKVIEQAVDSSYVSLYNKKLVLALGFFMGLLLGFGLVYMKEYFRSTFTKGNDIKKYLDTNLLGVVRKGKGDILWSGEAGEHVSPFFRDIRTKIGFYRKDHSMKTFLITSSVRKEGKTTCSEYLGKAFAESDEKVLIIDADLFNPLIAKLFNVESDSGLVDYIKGDKKAEEIIKKSDLPNLYVIPGGAIPSNPHKLIGSDRIKTLIDSVKDDFDIILVDSPPVCTALEVSILGSFVDCIVIIIKANETPRQLVLEVFDILKIANGNILGSVLNFMVSVGVSYYRRYYGYSSYGKKD